MVTDAVTRALVMAPTRELVVQIEENVRAYAKHVPLRMATVFGGVSERPQIEALRSGVDLVMATPGRLIDLMDQRYANFSGIEFLVLDEADRMLDMGFLPPIRRIVKALPQKRQTLMFSASLSREIERLTHEFQHSPKMVEIGRRANPAETVTQFVYEVRQHLKPALLLHLLQRSAVRHGSRFFAHETWRGQDRAPAREQRNQNRHDAFQSLAESAVARVERFQVRRGARAGGYRHCRARHRCRWDLACGELRFPDALGGLCPSHRTHRPRACHRRRDQFRYAGRSGSLRSLERFIGRGIVRKRAEGFDYNAAAPERDERTEDNAERAREKSNRSCPAILLAVAMPAYHTMAEEKHFRPIARRADRIGGIVRADGR